MTPKDKDLLSMFLSDEKQKEQAESLMNFYKASLANPFDLWKSAATMGFEMMRAMTGQSTTAPERGDRRFNDPVWESNPAFKMLRNSFLSWRSELSTWVDRLQIEDRDKDRAKLLLMTIADTVSPTNMLAGNPTAMKRTLETGGKNLVSGFQNFVSDMAENDGMPSMVDKSKFQVGGNIAVTPGKVVYREDHLELIQYNPQSETVDKEPVFLVPPQINKFYIWDLAKERSVVEYLLQQGFQVYCVSWFNPTAEQAEWGLDSYIAALDRASEAACEISKSPSLHMVGACSGGMTTSTLLGYWAARETVHAKTLTLLVTVLDTQGTANTSMGLMTSLEALELARFASHRKGVLEGKDLAKIFAWLRPNDLIWSYWVSNYLLGEDPPAFDLLYWNSDTTCLSAGLHSDFIDVLEENALVKPDALSVLGENIDLKKVTCDSLIVGGLTDHITPWTGCYSTVHMLGGEVEFIQPNSGHVQSVICPPTNKKAKYKTAKPGHKTPEEFDASAELHDGTWWTHWIAWLHERSTETRKAPKTLGSKKHPVLCDAPGTYVLVKAKS